MIHPPKLCLVVGNSHQDLRHIPDCGSSVLSLSCVTLPSGRLSKCKFQKESKSVCGEPYIPGNSFCLGAMALEKYIHFQKELVSMSCGSPLYFYLPSLHHIPTVLAALQCWRLQHPGLWHPLSLFLPFLITLTKSQFKSQLPKPTGTPVTICCHTICFFFVILITTCLYVFMLVFFVLFHIYLLHKASWRQVL